MVNRFGFKRNLIGGLLLLAGSLVMFAMAPTGGSFVVHVLPASLLAALGMALAYVPATIAGMSGAKAEESGLASGLINTSYQIGSAVGLAAMVAVSSAKAAAASAVGVPVLGALNTGFQAAFVGAAVIAAGGALVAALAVRAPRQADSAQFSDSLKAA
jgi:hypothetical protein